MKKIKSYSIFKFKNPQDREEFQNFCLMHFERGRKAELAQLYVDFLRQYYGDVRRETGRLKSEALISNRTQFNDDKCIKIGQEYEELAKNEVDDLLSCLNKRQRAIIILRGYWGLSFEEIAYIFNVSESRIFQIFYKSCDIIKSKEAS